MRRRYQPVIVLGSAAVAGGIALAVSTPWGLGLSPDSAVYVGAARSLLQGQGFSFPVETGGFAPIVQYPPLYSALLAGTGLVGIGPISAARWLNVLLFSFNIFLAGLMAFSLTASLRFSAVTAALVATAFPMVLAHSMAWSEPLFVCFELCGVLFLLAYFWQADSRSLIAAAVFFGLSCLSRYVGVALVMSGTLGISFIARNHWKRRIFDATVFFTISSLPIVWWVARNRWVAGSATNRQIGFHPVGLEPFGDLITTVLSWVSGLVSVSVRVQVLTAGLVLMGAVAFFLWTRLFAPAEVSVNAPEGSPARRLLALIIGNYLLLLYVSISALDLQVPIDSRILSPLYAPLVLLAVSLAHRATRFDWAFGRGQFMLAPLALLVIGLQLPGSLDWLRQLRRDGIGYSSRAWVESDVIKQLALLNPSVAIFSNAPDVVYTLAGRPAAMIPRKIYPDRNEPNHDYDSQIRAMKQSLKEKSGRLVYFDRVRWRWYLPSAAELEALGLEPLIRSKDGSIYRAN